MANVLKTVQREMAASPMMLATKNCCLLLAIVISTVMTSHDLASQVPESGAVLMDPIKVLGYESCAKCHEQEVKVWQQSRHHQTFRDLHRKPEAKQIADRLGLRSIKRGDVCINCHYTQQVKRGKVRAVSGISCESCHGPAQDWIKLHNDYGGEDVTKEQESAEHRAERRARSVAAGMNNPINPYLIARNCLNCHTVPHEELVNIGGHTAGSMDFDFVAWSQGSVRHNFLRGGGTSNAESSPDHLRLMYVVGLLADLEYSLRATAKATELDTYGYNVAARAHSLRIKLAELQLQLQNQYLQAAVDAALAVKLKTENADNLVAAADQVGAAAYAFAENVDGSTLGVVHSMMPAPASYK